jgi:hypothetical protein
MKKFFLKSLFFSGVFHSNCCRNDNRTAEAVGVAVPAVVVLVGVQSLLTLHHNKGRKPRLILSYSRMKDK